MKRYLFYAASFLWLLRALLIASSPVDGQTVAASFFYDEQRNVIRQERDTNGDGRMDRWIHYNRQGQIERAEQDANFDGQPDILIYYEAGKPKRQEIATKNDGQIDLWVYLSDSG
jgi:hypothetical protein